jgi:uncharacterized Tic20 family protein
LKKNTAFTHLSALTQYFIPLEIIFPILFGVQKRSSEFVDHHGKQVLNFQLSLLLYSLVLFNAVPTFLITLLIMFL